MLARWLRLRGVPIATVGLLMILGTRPVQPQVLNVSSGINVTGTASTNPTLAPKGQEKGDIWFDISPYFSVVSTTDGRFRLRGGGSLGASVRLSLREEDRFSTYLRPSGNLSGTWEVVDNFFFVDMRAGVSSQLNDPFLATTDPASPFNTSTSYQVGIAPYIRGRLLGYADYEIRSDNSWTDSPNTAGQYFAKNSVRIDRAPQPWGFAFSAEQNVQGVHSDDVPRRKWSIARLSLRYAPIPELAFGVRGGWERYDFLEPPADEPRTFYGFEARWRPNRRTVLEGYWENRYFGDSWQLRFSYRRPRVAFNIQSSRDLATTPTQFLVFQPQSDLVALVDAAFMTRIPDPVERQRAVTDFLARTQLPQQLLTPTVIYDERITLQTNTSGSIVFYGKRYSVAWALFRTRTEGIVGTASVPAVLADNLQRGTSLSYSRPMASDMAFSTTATWRRTESLLDPEDNYTDQTQIRAQISKGLGPRSFGTIGARYQWINSTVTNDATEAAIFCTFSHTFF